MHYIRLRKFVFIAFVPFLFKFGAFAQIIPQTFNCTGATQNFTVPPCVTSVTVEAWGAGGGGGGVDTYTGSPGGGGAYASSVIAVTPGQILTVVVGCGGLQGGACQGNGPGGAGGYGYGNGGSGGNSGPSGCSGPGGGGGGGSAVLNGGVALVVAGGGGGGGGGGNFGDGANGGGGGQAGSSQSSPGGILGASGSTNGLNGSSTGADGAGGGGGGGGVNGGGGGQVPGTDYGGSGGAGGTSLGSTVTNGSGQTPGNSASPYLCAGCAVGGNGGSGAPGVPGDVVILYNTPIALTSNISSTNGCASATATVTPTSGTGPYTYTWTPSGGNSATAGGLTNGPYTVNFTDANGCTGTNNITIALPTPVTGTVTNTPGTCGIATATVVASGGSGGYTYTWSPSGGNAATANISNGTFTVTIADAMGCVGTATTNVVLPPALTITATTTSITCNGLSNGSATATVGGGTGPTYTVAINSTPPQFGVTASTFAASALPAGSYTFGVQDGAGCQTAFPITISEPAVLNQTLTVTTPICAGLNSPINDAVSGGTQPYTVTWSSGGSFVGVTGTTTVSPVTTTTYSASVLDFNNCAHTATATVVVNPLPTVVVNSATICVGNSTTLTAGGANTYAWANATGLSGVTGTSVTANPVTSTVYTVTGTDANNCVNTATSAVTVNPLPTVTVNSATICAGSSTLLTAVGASSYTWSPGTGLSSAFTNTVTANPVSTTAYTITGADANNCTSTATATVTVNALPTVTVTSGVICNGSSVSLTAGGANTYSWNSGATLSSTTGNNVTAFPTTTTVYTVTGTDVNNCVSTATSTVTVNPLPIIAVNSGTICVSGLTTLNAFGASTYTWFPATGLSATTGNSVNANPPTTTNYTITGTDVNNCVNTGTATVTVNAPPVVVVSSATICVGSSATLIAGGATTYTWSPATGLSSTSGGTVTANPIVSTTYTITGSNGCISTTTAVVTVNPLPNVTATSATVCPTLTGTLTASGANTYLWNTGAPTSTLALAPTTTTVYTVVGTDVNNCSNFATATITVNPALVLTVGGTTPICKGATLNLTVNPGVAWAWQGPNAFASFSQNPSITNAQVNMSGTYSVGAQDTNGCQDTAFINIVVNPLPTPVASNNGPICSNQSLNFSGSGGGTYVWNGPAGFTNIVGQNPTYSNAPVTASGVYTLTVTDANGCVNTDTTLATVNPTPTVTVNSATICITYGAMLIANGVPLGGTYTWTTSPDLSDSTGSSVIATPTVSSTYSVTGISLAGCIGSATSTVVVNPVPIVLVSQATICAGQSTTLLATGASTYSWSPSTGLNSTVGASVVASPAVSITYTVVGTDVNGCINNKLSFVTVNQLPNVVASPLTTTGCEPLCVAFSNTGLNGGTYNWNFGDGNTDNTYLPTHCFSAGAYTVSMQVTDTNGCVNTSYANVVAYPTPVANFNASPQPTTILDPNINFLDLTTGGAVISTWGWNFGDGHGTSSVQSPSYTYQDTGTFNVQLIVTSDLGCADTLILPVTIEDEYLIYVPSCFTPNFDGMNDVFMPKGEGVTEYKLYVYDRWGALAFSSNDLMVGWDGRHLNKGHHIAQEDVYIWKIEAKNKKGEPKILKGTVSLVK